MHLGFGLAQPSEDGHGVAFGSRRKPGLLDHFDDVRNVAVGAGFLDVHLEPGSADAAALDLAKGHGGPGIERSDGVGNGGLVCARIGQRADKHVAADSREGVQVAGDGHEPLLWHGPARI